MELFLTTELGGEKSCGEVLKSFWGRVGERASHKGRTSFYGGSRPFYAPWRGLLLCKYAILMLFITSLATYCKSLYSILLFIILLLFYIYWDIKKLVTSKCVCHLYLFCNTTWDTEAIHTIWFTINTDHLPACQELLVHPLDEFDKTYRQWGLTWYNTKIDKVINLIKNVLKLLEQGFF